MWRPGFPLDLAATLGFLQRGRGDPTQQCTPEGMWRTARTPEGPGTMRLTRRGADVVATAWGPGAEWLLAGMPDLLGARDRPEEFHAHHPIVAESHRCHPGLRLPRVGLVFELLVPSVLEQKVTGAEAFRSWRELVRRFGDPAPGPAPAGLAVAPSAATLLRLPEWEWHRAGIDGRRRTTIIDAARVAAALERTVVLPLAEAKRRLGTLRGVGPWTVAEVAARAYGDADAVPVGDFHLPTVVGRALTGRPLDDAGLLDVLAPYAPQRMRAIRLLLAAGVRRPRFGPRYPVRDYRAD